MPIEVESPESLGYENIVNNLAESSVHDRKFSDINSNLENLVLNYGNHNGLPELRGLICEGSAEINQNNVLVCQAAAMALFIVNTSMLNTEDHLIVIRPNYATNIETPRAIGCEISFIDLSFDNSYALDIEIIKPAIKPNTKLISITNPHNPTGIEFEENTIQKIIKLAEEYGFYLLIDETYRELNFQSNIRPYFAAKSKNVISISSLSKAYGFPGLRIGWIICKNVALLELFLAAKEQIIISNSVVDEYLAAEILKNKAKYLSESHLVLSNNFNITKYWIENHPFFEWNEPNVGAVAFVRFKPHVDIDFELFYKKLLNDYGTMVGPGHWFEQTDRYFRLGFGFPIETEIQNGLNAIDTCLKEFI